MEVNCLDRLKIELVHKDYYEDEIYEMYLEENGLEARNLYHKPTMERRMLETVYSILDALLNNIDLYMKTETQFVTTSDAYKYLTIRISDLDKKIKSIPLTLERPNSFGYMFRGEI